MTSSEGSRETPGFSQGEVRRAAAVAAARNWALVYPIPAWNLAGGAEAERLAQVWGEAVADRVLIAIEAAGDAAAQRLREEVGEEYLHWLRRYGSAEDLTAQFAEAELRRLLDLHPGVAPEVAAWGLLRRVESWDEVAALQTAVAAVLRDQSSQPIGGELR